MKKLLFAMLVAVMCAGVAKAEEGGIYLKLFGANFTYPLSNLSAISLYDFSKGQGLIGGETSILNYKRINLNVGAISSLQADGTGFVSIDYDWASIITNLPPNFAKLGLWYGRNFISDENLYGIKASAPLW